MNLYLKSFFLITSSFFLIPSFAQSFIAKDNRYLRNGNNEYAQNKPLEAEKAYRKSIEVNPQNTTAQFNLGDALYMQKRYDEAATQFQSLTQQNNEALTTNSQYNLGNSFLEQKKYQEAINAYKEVLRKNPKDADARYNLAYAQAKLKEQEDEKKDKKQDEQSEDKQKEEEQKKQEEQKQKEEQQKQQNENKENEPEKSKDEAEKPQDKGEKPQDKGQQQKPSQISPQDAKRMMEALKNEEEKVRARVQMQRNQQQMGGRAGEKEKMEGKKDW